MNSPIDWNDYVQRKNFFSLLPETKRLVRGFAEAAYDSGCDVMEAEALYKGMLSTVPNGPGLVDISLLWIRRYYIEEREKEEADLRGEI